MVEVQPHARATPRPIRSKVQTLVAITFVNPLGNLRSDVATLGVLVFFAISF